MATTIPFGKHKDKDIEDLPNSYLHWLTEQNWFNDKFTDLSNKVVDELKYRDRWGIVINE